MPVPQRLRYTVARMALTVLLGSALPFFRSDIALAGGRANPPASLAGVDFLPAPPTALYPGGTAFASMSMDGATPGLTVTDAAGSTLAIRDAASDPQVLAWDGRGVDGTPIRAGNARLQFQHRKESHMIELRSIRWAMHAASGVTFTLRATAD